ncbi:hypothetical protein BYT27DRAFT_7187875 [Phlegmacium glaucopus]|nr:hypothetical protein BYT27DRAFT_7187875 [Phlegmacium glaucopus]
MSGQTVSLTVKELESTYGILFTGVFIPVQIVLCHGLETYDYYSRYPLDHWVIKATVSSNFGVWTYMDFNGSSRRLYYYLVLTFPDTPPLLDVTPAKSLVFSSITTPQAKGIMASSQGLTFLSGLSAFAALSYYLSPSPDPILEPSERLFNLVVVYTITRGSVATALQLGYFVAFIIVPTKPFWMPFRLVASRAFINSLLAMLNARKVHQGRGVNEEDITSRKTATTSSSSVSRISSNIRFAVAESKSGITAQVKGANDNGTTSRPFLHDEEAHGCHKQAAKCDNLLV